MITSVVRTTLTCDICGLTEKDVDVTDHSLYGWTAIHQSHICRSGTGHNEIDGKFDLACICPRCRPKFLASLKALAIPEQAK